MSRKRDWPVRSVLLAMIVSLLAGASSAPAQESFVQYSRDGAATLIQKDFGPERWSIHHRIQDGFV